MGKSKIKKWRDIHEIDYCPECGSPLLTNHNDSNIEAYAVCEDCGADTQLRFAEPYIQGVHGAMKDWADSKEQSEFGQWVDPVDIDVIKQPETPELRPCEPTGCTQKGGG